MARAKKKVENKIADVDHKKLQQFISNQTQILQEIGKIETGKQELLNQYERVSEAFKQFSSGLEHKYGKVSISVEDGTYKTQEELEKEQLAAEAKALKNGTDKKA